MLYFWGRRNYNKSIIIKKWSVPWRVLPKTMLMKKKLFLPIIFLAVMLLGVPLASKALVAKSGDSLAINETVNGNFFGAGNLVSVAGTVNGDVFVAGNTVMISGTINGDVFVAGSSIEISGAVNGNVRAIGSNINIRGEVERNVLAAGSSLALGADAKIGRNLTFAGASLLVNAPILGQIDAAGASAVLNSKVGGEVKLRLEEKGTLTLLSGARLEKDLIYTAPKEAQIDKDAKVSGEIKFSPWTKPVKQTPKPDLKYLKGVFLAVQGIGLISLFILGLILIYLLPVPMKKMYATMKDKFWPSVGFGLAVLILVPIACFLVLFTVVGAPISVIVMLIYGIALYIAKGIAGLALGKWIFEKLKWKIHDALALLLGLVLMTVLFMIPVIGWAFCFVLFLWALGGVYQIKKHYLKEMR